MIASIFKIITQLAPVRAAHHIQHSLNASSGIRWGSSLSAMLNGFQSSCPAATQVPVLRKHQANPLMQQCRTYKVKSSLKLRCSSCYFTRRDGRLYVECTAKPRHKQMQQIRKINIFRDDYTKGSPAMVRTACFAKFRQERYYDYGNNWYSRYNWLKGKIGKTI